MKAQKGITLIALIITIIVLLILAGVSISIVVGDNGILNQAHKAKVETKNALEQEQIELAYTTTKNRKNVLGEDGAVETFLQEELNKFEEGKYTVISANEEEIKVQSTDSKNIYTIKSDIVTSNLGNTGVSFISQINKSNFGDYVNYEVDLGIATAENALSDSSVPKTDWRIFYEDGNNIYIIASDYLPVSKFPSGVFGNNNGKYNGYWEINNPDTSKLTTSGTITKNISFLFTKLSNVTKSNLNYQAVATLLDTSKWSVFAKTGYVDDVNTSVIGTPTLEMWISSWNKIYGDELAFDVDANGYQVGLTIGSLSTYIKSSDMQAKSGYNNTLYYPHTITSGNDWNSCSGYWLASPSTDNDSRVMDVNCDGSVSRDFCYNDYFGVRPVVSLKSSITATKDANDVWQLGE